MNTMNNRYIAMTLVSILFFYQLIGVTIHKQYGFGFFYWPIQEGLLVFFSLFYLLGDRNAAKYILKPPFYLLHFFIWLIIIIQITYLLASYPIKIDKIEQYQILISNFSYYVISMALILNFETILCYINRNKLFILYFIILFFFFLYDFHIQKNAMFALTIGPNFSPKIQESLPGYTWGFHLFFSPFFAILSIVVILYLKKKNHMVLYSLLTILSLYVLLLAGGRGTLLSFFTVLFLFIFSKRAKIITIISIIGITTTASFLIDIFSDNPRMHELLTFNLGNDPSGQGRIKLLEQNLRIINDNFFIGSFHSYYHGKYIHNILSILQDYGFWVFLYFWTIIFHGIYLFIFTIKKHSLLDDFALDTARIIFFFSLIDHLLFKYSSTIRELTPIIVTYGYAILVLNTNYLEKTTKERKLCLN